MSLQINDEDGLELARPYQRALSARSMTHAIHEALERSLRALNGSPPPAMTDPAHEVDAAVSVSPTISGALSS